MKKVSLVILGVFLILPMMAYSQVYVDPNFIVPAEVSAFRVDQAPVIDGNDADWANVPWSAKAYYNDRDYNGDGYPDPLPDRRDFQGRFKAVWMDGVNMLYLLLERYDDEILSDDETSWYHVDGFELRIDPFNSDAAGEPSGEGTAYNLGFRVGKDTHNGIEGPLPTYEAKWMVDDTVFPSRAVLEIAITLPEGVSLVEGYAMGFHIYFNETDNDDDTPGNKNAALQLWPQLYDVTLGEKLGVDATWANIHSWGDLVCVDMPTVHTVSGGGTGVIQDAIDAAAPGDIIKVEPGEYFENIVIDKPRIRLIGTMTETDTSVIHPDIVGDPAITIAGEDVAPDVIIKDLTFNGQWDDNGTLTRSALGLSVGSAEAKILHNVVTWFDDFLDARVGDYGYGHNVVIEDNIFYNSSGGVYFNRPNTICRYNHVSGAFGGYGLDSKGLQTGGNIDMGFNVISDIRQCGIGWGGDGGVFTIHHNVVYRSFDERTTPTREMDDGIENQEDAASTSYIYNNDIIGWDSDGAQLNGPSNFYSRNNIIVNNDNFAYDIRNVPTALDVDYLISNQNGKGSFDAAFASNFGTHIYDLDPMFADELEDNYALAEGSPAIDAGKFDPLGFKLFYAGDSVDIGAIEYGVQKVTTYVENNNTSSIVSSYRLHQNYPNPFNPSTTIQYELVKSGHVTLKVYDITGKLVSELVNKNDVSGIHEIEWSGEGFASGVYFYTLQTEGLNLTKKMLLIK